MPINQQLDGVFIHVSDMQRAIDWYSRLLDVPMESTTHEDMIYNLPIGSGPQIILDAYPKPTSPRGTGPRVMFSTPDIHPAHAHALELSAETSAVEDIGSSLVFYLEDPDGNLICIRQLK